MSDTGGTCPNCKSAQLLTSSADGQTRCAKCGVAVASGEMSSSTFSLAGSFASGDETEAIRRNDFFVQRLLEEQRRRFENGDAISAESILEKYPSLASRKDALVDVVYNDFLLRKERGLAPDYEEYLQRFPGIAAELRVQFELDRAMDGSELAGQATAFLSGSDEKGPPATIYRPADHSQKSESTGEGKYEGPRYRVLRPHARGGLGEVFVAKDNELQREVALKEIKEQHADDQESRARFLQEAEITGRLEHPGIVPVYGLNTYEDGRPYYAMRFIHGESLKQAIQRFHSPESKKRPDGERHVELQQLLNRFQDSCHAIAYAHSKGVLHRDIKPDNIMLGPYGETLVVDWGLAKEEVRSEENCESAVVSPESGIANRESEIIEHELIEETIDSISHPGDSGPRAPDSLTQTGAVLGTPAYMSPEQASGNLKNLTPASDVYSLGATLYTLLTGKAPFQGSDVYSVLEKAGRGEWAPPRKVNSSVPAALDAVCRKAMAVRPENRYQTAEELSDDIDRWLADEPVTAYREPFLVRFARWRRRHRTLVLSASALLFALLSATAIGSYMVAQEQAKTASVRKELTRQEITTAQEQKAKLQALQRAEKVSNYLFGVLRSPDPAKGDKAYDIRIGNVLDDAVQRVEADFRNDPLTRADIFSELARTYQSLGVGEKAAELYAKSWPLRKTALGENHPDTLESMRLLGNAYQYIGKPKDAVALLENVVQRMSESANTDRSNLLCATNDLAAAYDAAGEHDKSLSLFEKSLAMHVKLFGSDSRETSKTMARLAHAHLGAGQHDKARLLAEHAYQSLKTTAGADHPDTLFAMLALGRAHSGKRDYKTAIALLDKNLHYRQKRLGARHRDTVATMSHLAHAHNQMERFDLSLPLFEKTLNIRREELGDAHPYTTAARNDLGNAYHLSGQSGKAIPHLATVLKATSDKRGPKHPETIATTTLLAEIYRKTGRFKDAISLYQQLLQLYEPTNHPGTDVAAIREYLLEIYRVTSRFGDAEKLLSAMLKKARQKEHADKSQLADLLDKSVTNLLRLQKPSEAEPLARECLAIRASKTPNHWRCFSAKSLLGASLAGQRQYAEAEPLLIQGYEGLRSREKSLGAENRSQLTDALGRIVRLYDDWGKTAQVNHWREKLGAASVASSWILTGVLTKKDPKDGLRSRYTSHDVTLKAGRFYCIQAAAIFWTRVHVKDPRNGLKRLARDRRSFSQGSESRLLFVPPRTDTYQINVNQYATDRRGQYYLYIQELTPLPVYESSGTLTKKDKVSQGRIYHDHQVRLKAGAVYAVEQTGKDIDSYLFLLNPAGTRDLAANNDIVRGGVKDSRVFFAPPLNGVYRLRASTNPIGQTGDYRLRVWELQRPDLDSDTLRRLAKGYRHAGRFRSAVAMLKRALEIRSNDSDPQRLRTLSELAHMLVYAEQSKEAAPIFEEILKHTEEASPADAAKLFVARTNLAAVYWATGNYDKSMTLFEKAAANIPPKLPPETRWFMCVFDEELDPPPKGTAQKVNALIGRINGEIGRRAGSELPFMLTLKNTQWLITIPQGNTNSHNWFSQLLRKLYDRYHPHSLPFNRNREIAYRRAGNNEKVGESLRDTYSIEKTAFGATDPQTLLTAIDLALLTLKKGDVAKAAELAKLCHDACKKDRADHWLHFQAMSVYGECMTRTKKYAQAEPLLIAGYEGLKTRSASLPPLRAAVIDAARERIVRHYEVRGQNEKARAWRGKSPSK